MSLCKALPPCKALSAVAATTAALAIGAPAASADPPSINVGLPTNGAGQICFSGFADPGAFGPNGPYGASGPYGPNGPLHGRPNPIGDTASCGGLLTYLLRGGNVNTFVNANLASVGITPPAR